MLAVRVRRGVPRADAIFNADGIHVVVRRGHRKLVITVEIDLDITGWPECGVLAIGDGRREVKAADTPCFGVPVLIIWLMRIWRCADADCPMLTWSETRADLATDSADQPRGGA